MCFEFATSTRYAIAQLKKQSILTFQIFFYNIGQTLLMVLAIFSQSAVYSTITVAALSSLMEEHSSNPSHAFIATLLSSLLFNSRRASINAYSGLDPSLFSSPKEGPLSFKPASTDSDGALTSNGIESIKTETKPLITGTGTI